MEIKDLNSWMPINRRIQVSERNWDINFSDVGLKKYRQIITKTFDEKFGLIETHKQLFENGFVKEESFDYSKPTNEEFILMDELPKLPPVLINEDEFLV